MKFIKLKLKNFKPYYDKPGIKQEINLFNKDRKGKNLTLNIGPTGHGKTSISEALLWCLFGDYYYNNWEEFINTLSREIAKQRKVNKINISVELVLEIEEDYYRLIRHGIYDITKGQKVSDSELSVIHAGEPISNPIGFVGNHFPPLELMTYFIFDADDILKKFEENRKRAIKDHINKIVGVEKLDGMIESLEEVVLSYDKDIRNIEIGIHSDVSDKIGEKEKDKAQKEEAINHLEREIQSKKEEKQGLFYSVSPEIKKFSELVDEKDKLEEEIIKLNKQFVESNIVADMDLLLIYCIVDDAIEKLNQKQTTKEEFETSSIVIKSSLGKDYSGIFFDDKKNTCLIKVGARIWDEDLDNLEKLNLKSGEGIKSNSMSTFKKYKKKISKLKLDFEDYKNDFDGTIKALMMVENKIKLIGDTTENRELKDKLKKYNDIEDIIRDKKEVQHEIREKKKLIKKEIEELRNELKLNEEQKKKIEQIIKKQNETQILLNIAKKSREEFLHELLSYINKTASESLRSTVKYEDKQRFHSIEVDSNYQFRVKQSNGKALKERQINLGYLQVSMMSFFFGLSKFLGKKIPYVIDDPLLRLDPGHDKRLIKQLCKTSDQLIFHMIPGKEYTTDSFNWLKPYINIQNWLGREEYKGLDYISYAECKDPDKKIYFNIDKF